MRLLIACLLAVLCAAPLRAETALQILTANAALVEKASRQSIAPVIDALAESGDPAAPAVLQAWGDKSLGLRKADGAFFLISPDAAGYALRDLTGAGVGTAAKSEMIELKPNAGVRAMIATALVQFTLSEHFKQRLYILFELAWQALSTRLYVVKRGAAPVWQ